jgi:beta-barrel assembly-enhancing protease
MGVANVKIMTSFSGFVARRSRRGWPALVFIGLFAPSLAAWQLISVDDEIRLGRAAQEEVRKSTPEVTDRAVAAYLEGIGQRLVAHAGGPEYPYSFSVVTYAESNAFALPGGPVWMHRGAIEAAQNEAQLAGVLAHEIAHIANRHSAGQISKGLAAQVGLGLLAALLGDAGRGAQIAQMGAAVAAGATMAKFSRDDEREADQQGLIYMSRAGYNPRGMVEFMQILRERAGRDPRAVEVFFASHPAPQERIERLEQQARALGAQGSSSRAELDRVKTRLAALGPAQSARPPGR